MLFPWVLFSGGKSRSGEVVKVGVSGENPELCALLPAALQVLCVPPLQRLRGLPRDAAAQVPVPHGACPAAQEDAGR